MLHQILTPKPLKATMSYPDMPPSDAASVAKAKAAAEAERHAVLELVTTARQGALYLLDFYPDSLPALMEYFCLCETFGVATMERAVREAKSEKFGPSSAWDPRR